MNLVLRIMDSIGIGVTAREMRSGYARARAQSMGDFRCLARRVFDNLPRARVLISRHL